MSKNRINYPIIRDILDGWKMTHSETPSVPPQLSHAHSQLLLLRGHGLAEPLLAGHKLGAWWCLMCSTFPATFCTSTHAAIQKLQRINAERERNRGSALSWNLKKTWLQPLFDITYFSLREINESRAGWRRRHRRHRRHRHEKWHYYLLGMKRVCNCVCVCLRNCSWGAIHCSCMKPSSKNRFVHVCVCVCVCVCVHAGVRRSCVWAEWSMSIKLLCVWQTF